AFQLPDALLSLCRLLTQPLIFFFQAHRSTLPAFTTFGKSQADLGSYLETTSIMGSLFLQLTPVMFRQHTKSQTLAYMHPPVHLLTNLFV
ncbi:MAG TPA: hypothetical protein VFA09_04220, partial [Ktedonobacteraceae bacterium]|nr:hypothetical protein [Ktedonobacteraceae bacterium]